MPTITKKEYEEYIKLRKDKNNGRILTTDGLRLICETYDKNPEAIGKYMLEVLASLQDVKIKR